MENNTLLNQSIVEKPTFTKILSLMTANYDIISETTKYLIIITSFIVCIISYLLYAIVCYLILTRKKLQTRANFVTSMLFVSGAILGVIIIPMIIAGLLCTKIRKSESYRAAESYLLITYVIANIKSISIISLVTATHIRTQRHVKKKYIIYSMLYSCASALLFPGVLAYIGLHYGLKALGLTLACGIALSFATLYASYGFVRHEVKKLRKRLSFTDNQTHNSTYKKKVKKTIDRILFAFIVTNISFFVRGVVLIYKSFNKEVGIKYKMELSYFNIAAYLIMTLSIVINPLIYFYTQSDLRKEVRKLWIYKRTFFKESTDNTSSRI